jgi:hypothetical protein
MFEVAAVRRLDPPNSSAVQLRLLPLAMIAERSRHG